MVLVSMTILIIMGTLFTTISMRSYLYSYAKLCKQQAYYTAMSSVQSFHSLLKGNPGLIGTLTNSLNEALDDEINAGFEITDVTIEIGSTYGDGGEGYVPNGFFDSYMGRCTLKARYASADRNEISIEANANYKGYSDFARAKIARTNAAASELKKIFDNTFCLQSPISTIVGVTEGDVYISQPALTEFTGDSLTDEQKAYNAVLGALKEGGTYKGYSALPGQYIRDESGQIVTGDSTILAYNNILREELYGKVQANTLDSNLVGHTRPMDIYNYPMPTDFTNAKVENGMTFGDKYFNDWVELYMFAPSSDGTSATTAINGNVYAHSRILIGLLDKDKSNELYPYMWDDVQKRQVFPKGSNANAPKSESVEMWQFIDKDDYVSTGKNDYDDKFSNSHYEHGFAQEVFFDNRDMKSLTRAASQLRVNGHLYLWEDARIENFDSTKTQNAQNGIKNNIYAYKNLVIDGTYIENWTGAGKQYPTKNIDYPANLPSNKYYVTIYGDVIVQGNAQIIGANITGDVYCFGDQLTMVNTNVNGNVYFAGGKFSSDNILVSGNLIIENVPKDNKPNVSYTSYDKDKFGSEDTVGRAGSSAQWGAVLTNTHIYGSLWSAVNTHIVAAKWSSSDLQRQDFKDVYGNIYVKSYLFIDGTRTYAEGYNPNWDGDTPPGSTTASSFNAVCNHADNAEKENATIFANKLQIATSQSRPIATTDKYEMGNILVGEGGARLDGHTYFGNETLRLRSLNSASNTNIIYDTNIHGENNRTTNREIGKKIYQGADSIDDALNRRLKDLMEDFLANDGENPRISVSNMQYECFGRDSKAEKEIWKGKVIKLRKWSAPEHKTETEIQNGEPGTYYNGYDVNAGKGFSDIENFVDYILGRNDFTVPHPEAGEVSNGKLVIKESVIFGGEIDFEQFSTVVFDTSNGNIHVRVGQSLMFGNANQASKVVLKGGNMVFLYLENEKSFNDGSMFPALTIKENCSFGVVEASQGSNYGNDGLYVISNNDSLIWLGATTEFNGFVYAPRSQVFVAPGTKDNKNTFNGCMAIESFVIINDADKQDNSLWEQIQSWWGNLTWTNSEVTAEVVKQYSKCVYNYVMPPLIVDAGMSYGGTDDEVVDFGQVVWEFMGFY